MKTIIQVIGGLCVTELSYDVDRIAKKNNLLISLQKLIVNLFFETNHNLK